MSKLQSPTILHIMNIQYPTSNVQYPSIIFDFETPMPSIHLGLLCYVIQMCIYPTCYVCSNTPHMPLYVKHEYFVAYYSERQWVLMIETSILNGFIKIRHHFVKINQQSPTESYQLITFAICRRTGSGWKQQLSLKVWSIEHAKTLQ